MHRLDEKWIWDFWFARRGDEIHMFYLQADRALGDPDLRHWNVSVGHAVSHDLVTWRVRPDALRPQSTWTGPEPADSKTTWTGSVVEKDGLYWMFYTGGRASENGLVQRVCLATSPDLDTWTRHRENPILSADPTWYETLDMADWVDESWRDPFVFWCPHGKRYRMLVTARVRSGDPAGRGVVACADSLDLLNWTVGPPVVAANRFGEMEVPQLVTLKGRRYLVFSTSARRFAPDYAARYPGPPVTGVHYYVCEDPGGPFEPLDEAFFVGDAHGSVYSGKLIEAPNGRWCFMAFRNHDQDGRFIGDVDDPRWINVDADGRLVLVDSADNALRSEEA